MTGALELYVINVDGTGLMQITNDGLPHAVPHWSPDGTHIVFNTAGRLGLGAIATVRADGTELKILSSPVWDSFGAQFTGDGKHIVFSTQTGGYVSSLWIMDTNGQHQRRLTAPELEAGAPDVSADGKDQVVFYNHQNTPLPTSCVFKMNIDGTDVRCLTGMGNVNTLPVFSPDGTRILFMSDRVSRGAFDTYVMNADGSHKTRIIPGGLVPNWGPRP
jgi:Tol biopolymer transport system component